MASEDAVTVVQTGPSTWRVVTPAGTVHQVSVPLDLAEALGSGVDEARLVRESFGFLLEREPASAILADFSLDMIGRYFPEYMEEMRSRL